MGYGALVIATLLVFMDARGSELNLDICANVSDISQGSSGGGVSWDNRTDFVADLPPGWSRYCTTQIEGRSNFLNVSCAIGENAPILIFKDFQIWAKNKSTIKYKLRLTCSPGGVVSLPWPMRAYHLVHLEVRNCNIVDFYLDSFNESIASISDELQVIIIDSCVIQYNICHISLYTDNYNETTRDFFCGPERLRTYVATNVNSVVTGNTRAWSEYHEYVQRVTFKYKFVTRIPRYTDCVYSNLEIRDESVDSDRVAFGLQNLVAGKKFPQLKRFNISHTRIRQICRELQDWQLYFPKLENLDISWNAIETFYFKDHMSVARRPLMINLQRNNITKIDNSTLLMLKYLKSTIVDIRNNPFMCDCEMLYFSNFVKNSNKMMHEELKNYRYFFNLTCSSPKHHQGKRISSLGWYDLCPDKAKVMIVTIVLLSVMIFVLIFVIIVVVRYRHEVIILCYTRLHTRLSCRLSHPIKTKSYDAFIAHSNEDTRWVIKELALRLENPKTGKALKLCLPDRDFDLGAATAENIIKSVENSRHTLLVISKNFLKNEWCLFEFRSAFRQCFVDKKHHLVILLLEEVSLIDLETDLKLCMKTFTRIKVGQWLFWDRIVFALADRCKKQTAPLKSWKSNI